MQPAGYLYQQKWKLYAKSVLIKVLWEVSLIGELYMSVIWLQKRVKIWVLPSRLIWVIPTLLAKLNLYWKFFTKYKDYLKGEFKYECNYYIPPFLSALSPAYSRSVQSCQNLVSTLQCTWWNWTPPVAQVTLYSLPLYCPPPGPGRPHTAPKTNWP